MNTIRENILEIRARMDAAARAAGRDPGEILLCAASKMNDAKRVHEAAEGGVDCCPGKPVHFIGHLQTNKVNKVVGAVDLIQSVDRPELLAAVNKEALKKGLVQNILLEVNIGAEVSKSGFTPEETLAIAAKMGDFPGVHLCGLMAIPPISKKVGDNRKYFAEMANLFVDIRRKKYDNVHMVCLSMGMSDDFEDAIAEGSTMIRVGTAIFGARNYVK